MTTFWSLFIAVITLASLAGCAALLIWYSKSFKDIPDGAELEHEVDGIRELNHPLPKWWSYMFWATLIFALFYLFAYGLGGFKGFFNWQSSDQQVKNLNDSKTQHSTDSLNQYARELVQADQRFGAALRALTHDAVGERLKIKDIAQNSNALKAGQRLFLQNCSQCHGSDARGQIGFPNLTDNDWLWGGEPEDIQYALINGHNAITTIN